MTERGSGSNVSEHGSNASEHGSNKSEHGSNKSEHGSNVSRHRSNVSGHGSSAHSSDVSSDVSVNASTGLADFNDFLNYPEVANYNKIQHFIQQNSTKIILNLIKFNLKNFICINNFDHFIFTDQTLHAI